VALTFDCGYGPDTTRSILATLARVGARATFFLEGSFIQAYPELVVRMVAGGHELGNHSTTHRNLTSLDAEEIADELDTTESLIGEVLEEWHLLNDPTTHYFRFPFGARDGESLDAIASRGYQSVFWSVDPKGWRSGATATGVTQFVLDRIVAGDIIIQHCNSQADAEALPEIVSGIRSRGLQVGTVSEAVRLSDLPLPRKRSPFAIPEMDPTIAATGSRTGHAH
jgi:peptidoglycan/xylan/chitin deacetylase (PgdA/CDA1 family)